MMTPYPLPGEHKNPLVKTISPSRHYTVTTAYVKTSIKLVCPRRFLFVTEDHPVALLVIDFDRLESNSELLLQCERAWTHKLHEIFMFMSFGIKRHILV